MKKISVIFIITLLITSSCDFNDKTFLSLERGTKKSAPSSGEDVQLSDFEVMGYLPYWGYINDSKSTTNYDKYYYYDISTVLILATIGKASVLSNEGLIYGYLASHSSNVVDIGAMVNYIRSSNPGIKIILALSDMHNTPTERAETAELVNDTNRSRTINWLMTEYVDKYGFDGIDIDFEDATLDNNYMGLHYSNFIKDLATTLHNRSSRGKRKLCTATLSGNDYGRSVITSDFINSIDMLGIQTYSADKMDYVTYNTYRNMVSDYNNWRNVGLPESKMTFGLGMWSRIADPSKRRGHQLPSSGPSNGWSWVEQLKLEPAGNRYRPYLTSSFNTPGFPGRYEQRYNGLYDIRRRAEWVKSKSCRGVFGWDLSKDPNRNDVSLRKYSYFLKLMDWRTSPQKYLPIVAYTTKDYYGSGQTITMGFHSLSPDLYNWVGCYEFDTSKPFNIGQSLGVFQYFPNQDKGTYTLPSSWTDQMTSNKMYILKIANGANAIGNTEIGTSNPFYKL